MTAKEKADDHAFRKKARFLPTAEEMLQCSERLFSAYSVGKLEKSRRLFFWSKPNCSKLALVLQS